MQDDRNHGQHQQNVNQSSGNVKRGKAEKPHHQQDKKEYEKHSITSTRCRALQLPLSTEPLRQPLEVGLACDPARQDGAVQNRLPENVAVF
jgi:hypothetical protein